MAKRTTVRVELEIEGMTASGHSVLEWLRTVPGVHPLHVEDRFRILRVNLLGEDRA